MRCNKCSGIRCGETYFMDMDLTRLFELDTLAKNEAKRFAKCRLLYDAILKTKGKTFTGIVGPRGAGKTVLLRQFALGSADSFYLSLDTFSGTDLFALARTLAEKYGVKTLLLDEIHFLKGYEAALKSIFDFLELRDRS